MDTHGRESNDKGMKVSSFSKKNVYATSKGVRHGPCRVGNLKK